MNKTLAPVVRSRKAVSSRGLFKVKTLHRPQRDGLKNAAGIGEKEWDRNARGMEPLANLPTIAAAPSLYYYLSVRAGMPFDEIEKMVDSKRIKMPNGDHATVDGLLQQYPWHEADAMNIQVETTEGKWVAARDRSAHRTYALANVHAKVITQDPSDPLHHKNFFASPPDASFHLVRLREHPLPGLALLTTDRTIVPYLENPSLGSYGAWEVSLPQETPSEEFSAAMKKVEAGLAKWHREHSTEMMPYAPEVVCSASASHHRGFTVRAHTFPRKLHHIRREYAAKILCTQLGPLMLPADLKVGKSVPLPPEEQSVLMDFVKQLRIGRVVQILRDGQRTDEEGEGEDAEIEQLLRGNRK